MADVLFEQVQGDGVERLGDRGNLGEDVDAVLIFVDHAGDAADLPFDAAQALEVRLFVGGVTVLGFRRLTAAACAGVRLSGLLGWFFSGCAGCGADLSGCAVAALVAGGFHDSSIYPRGVLFKVNLRYNLHNLYEFYFYYKDVCFSFVFDVEVIMVSKNGKIADFLKIQKILLASVITLIFIAVSFVLSLRGTSEPNIWAILSGLAAVISSLIAINTAVKRNIAKLWISIPLVLATVFLIVYLYFSGREESVVWGIVSGVFGIISVIISIFQGKDVELEREKKIERRKSRYLIAKDNLNSGDTSIKKEAVRELLTNSAQWMSDDKCMPEERDHEIQNIIDTLCEYIKSPCNLKNVHEVEGEKAIRKLIIDEISSHLSRGIPDDSSWSRYDFDFSGAQIFYPFMLENVKIAGKFALNNIQIYEEFKIKKAVILNQELVLTVKRLSGILSINNSSFDLGLKLEGSEELKDVLEGSVSLRDCKFGGSLTIQGFAFADGSGLPVVISGDCEFKKGITIENCDFSSFTFRATCLEDLGENDGMAYSVLDNPGTVLFRNVNFRDIALFNNSEFWVDIKFINCNFKKIISFNSVKFFRDVIMRSLRGKFREDNPDFENSSFNALGEYCITVNYDYERYMVDVYSDGKFCGRLPYLARFYNPETNMFTKPAIPAPLSGIEEYNIENY